MDDVYNNPQQLRDVQAMTRHPRLRRGRADHPTAGRVMTEPAGIEPEHFRRVLAQLFIGVSVITTHSAGGPTGMTANSVTSVSLDPPLVLLCPTQSSTTWSAIRARCGRILRQRDGRSPCRSHVPTSQPGEAFYELSPRRQGRLRAGAAGLDRHLLRPCHAGESKGHGAERAAEFNTRRRA